MLMIYEVINQGTDGMDSRRVAFFASLKAAREANKGQGAMGVGDGEIREHKVYDSHVEYREMCPEAIRARALAKLTAEERKVLHLE